MGTSKINQFLQISPVPPKHQKKEKGKCSAPAKQQFKTAKFSPPWKFGGCIPWSIPIKNIFIPKPELQAAVLARRFKTTIVELKLHIERVRLWSDSLPVIKYFQNENVNF